MNQIAFYQIDFLYMDNQKLNFKIGKEKLANYFEKLQNNNLFWFVEDNDTLDNGFWTDINKIRTIQVKAVKGVNYEDGNLIKNSEEIHCSSESDNSN